MNKELNKEKTSKEKSGNKDGLLAVIRVRGRVGARRDAELALKQLRLTRKNHCVLIDAQKAEGAVKKVGDYVTWGEADGETAALLEKVRALQGGGKDGKVFRLQPPRKGFKGGTKKRFPKGALGYRGKAINGLIKAMLPINVK